MRATRPPHVPPNEVDPPMSAQASPLGRCPDCDVTIPAGRLLIEYERDDGPACYAECPGCREVVRPRSKAG